MECEGRVRCLVDTPCNSLTCQHDAMPACTVPPSYHAPLPFPSTCHARMRRFISPTCRLWKNADAAYITDRLSRLATVAHELANKAVLDRDFKAKLEELTQGVGKALSEGSRRELEGQFEGMTTAAARLATRLQQAERRGWSMSGEGGCVRE